MRILIKEKSSQIWRDNKRHGKTSSICCLFCEDGTFFLVIPDIFNRESIPSCHARQLLSGIYLGCVSNGSPLTDGGDDEREEWMSATNLRIGAIRVLSVTIMNGKMFHLRSILQTRD